MALMLRFEYRRDVADIEEAIWSRERPLETQATARHGPRVSLLGETISRCPSCTASTTQGTSTTSTRQLYYNKVIERWRHG